MLKKGGGRRQAIPYQPSSTLSINLQGLKVTRCMVELRGSYFHFHLLSYLANKICSQFINMQRIDPAYAALIILFDFRSHRRDERGKLSDSCLVV
jgi:hypothetical protein